MVERIGNAVLQLAGDGVVWLWEHPVAADLGPLFLFIVVATVVGLFCGRPHKAR